MLIYLKLKEFYNFKQLDVFSLYLFGVICKEVNQLAEARAVLKQTLNSFPYLWSAWLELLSISKTNDMTDLFRDLDNHWMKYFFKASFFSEKDHEPDAIELCNALLIKFPNSVFLIDTIAHSYYCLQGMCIGLISQLEYDLSQENFEKLIIIDPYRLENMDTFSNILFIKENFSELVNLAYKCHEIDKYRPETSCIIGNYYSLKSNNSF